MQHFACCVRFWRMSDVDARRAWQTMRPLCENLIGKKIIGRVPTVSGRFRDALWQTCNFFWVISQPESWARVLDLIFPWLPSEPRYLACESPPPPPQPRRLLTASPSSRHPRRLSPAVDSGKFLSFFCVVLDLLVSLLFTMHFCIQF